jgi:hypothetical protein
MATGKDNGANLPLSRPSREREGPAKREGEGLYIGLGKDPHLPPLRGGSLLSREKRERIRVPSGRGRARRSGCSGR